MAEERIRGAGGTQGGCGLFSIGFCLSLGALYFFLDSVRAVSGGYGLMTGLVHRAMGAGDGHGMWDTTSMGIIFVPFFIGVIIMFYDYRLWFGQALTTLGLAVIVVEILSRICFSMNVKTTHLLMMIVMMAAGVGLMIRSFRDESRPQGKSDEPSPPKAPPAGP